jgi:toxin ParE1/3/4
VIEWTGAANSQLNQAHDYIASANGEEIAARIMEQIISTVQRLESFPMLGRQGRVAGTSELVIANTPFIATYTLAKDRIVILALYHGAQRWPEVF